MTWIEEMRCSAVNKEKESIVQNVYHIAMGDEFKEVMNQMGSFAQVLMSKAASEAAYDRSLEIAASMLLDNYSVAAIMKHARLSREAVLDLAAELGVDPREDPDTP